MKERGKHSQVGLKLYTYLDTGREAEFSKWLRKHSPNHLTDGINEGCGQYKCSLLLRAASMRSVKWEDIVCLIDRFKADVMRKDLNRWTVLHWAAHGDNAAIVRKLIHRYDQVKQLLNNQACANKPGDSALMVAAEGRHYHTFHALLDAGADPLIVNSQGKIVLDVLQEQQRLTDLQRVLHTCIHQDRFCLIDAASQGHWDIIKRVLTKLDDQTKIEQKGKNGETLLHIATCEGKADLVETLLKRNADPNIGDEKGYTPLFCSVDSTSSAACAELLLRHDANVTLLDKSECTVFHHIAYEGRLDILTAVKEIIQPEVLRSVIDLPCGARTLHSPVLSRRVTLQGSALQIAAVMGKHHCIPLLVQFGADIHCQDVKGRTVTEIILDEKSSDSSRNSHDLDKVLALLYTLDPTWQQAKRLMEVNFDPDFRCENGETLLHMACKSSDSPRTIRLFLDSLASPSLLDDNQNPPLFYAIVSKGNRSLEIVKLLLDYDAQVVFHDKHGGEQNMLMVALLYGNDTAANVILDSKTSAVREDLESHRITSKDIMTMILNGHLNSLQFLKDTLQLSYLNVLLMAEDTVTLSDIMVRHNGVLMYNCDKSEQIEVTPLQLAALCGNVDIVRFLQCCGVDTAEANSNSETAQDLMQTFCNVSNQKVRQVQMYLEQVDMERDSLDGSSVYLNGHIERAMAAPATYDVGFTQSLHEIRDLKISYEQTSRTTSASKTNNQMSRLGADSNRQKPRISNKSIARLKTRHSSAYEIKPSMIWKEVRDALENGANPNLPNEKSSTPLHLFCEKGKSMKIIELLLQNGANPNMVNKAGHTPLTNTILSKGPRIRDIIEMLLEYGAEIILKVQDSNKQVKNPFRIAIENELTNIASLLYSYSPEVLKAEVEMKPITLEYVCKLVSSNNLPMIELLTKDIGLPYMKQYLEANAAYEIPDTLTEDIPLATLLEEPDNQHQGRKTVSFAQDLLCPGSSLHVAALQCNVSLLKGLLSLGVSPDSRDSRGRTPLQLLHACTLFFRDEYKARLPEVLPILGASGGPHLTFRTSMTSLDDLDDMSSVFGSLSRAQSNMNVSSAKTVAQVQYGIRSSLKDCFKQIDSLFESSSELVSNRHNLSQIETRVRSEVETYLALLSNSGETMYGKSISRELLDTCDKTTRDIDRLIAQTGAGDVTNKTDCGGMDSDYIMAERYVIPMPRKPGKRKNASYQSIAESESSYEVGTTRSAPPYIPRINVSDSPLKSDHNKDGYEFNAYTSMPMNATKLTHASPELGRVYDDVVSYELFEHIAKRMEQRKCGWAGLVEELTAGQGTEVQQRIKEDIQANHSDSRSRVNSQVYEALILWKLYTPDAEERSRRLRRALDALGMSDLADELAHVMQGQG